MCFSQEISLLMALVGLAGGWRMGGVATDAGRSVLFFALMEFLQFLQHFYIDQCGHPVNEALTAVGMVHIALQPYFVTLFYLGTEARGTDAGRRSAALRTALAFAPLYLLRFVLVRMGWEGTRELPADWEEPLCSTRMCTFSGERHLAWTFDLAPPNYFLPHIGMHGFLFFVMPVVALGAWRIPLVLLATGPVATWFLTQNRHERPAIWCYFSIAQLIVTYFYATWNRVRVGAQAAPLRKSARPLNRPLSMDF